MTPIALGPNRGKLALLLFVALSFVFGGVFILSLGGDDLRRTLTGWAAIVFFGACAGVFAVQLLDARPRIVLDDEGVLDRSLPVGVIPWSEILDARVQASGQNHFVALHLRNPARFTGKLGPVHRRLVEANTALGFEPLNLNLGAVNADAFVIAELIGKEAVRRREQETYRA